MTPRGAARAMRRPRLTEIVVALLGCVAVAASLWAAPGGQGIVGAALALVMLAIAVIDARSLRIPNELNAVALALALINTVLSAPVLGSLAEAALRGAVTMLVFLGIRIGYRRLRGREGLGLGDVKLAFVAGAWLDWLMIAVAVELAAVAALAGYVLWPLLAKQPLDAASRLPFGLFFAPAIWAAWLLAALLPGLHLP